MLDNLKDSIDHALCALKYKFPKREISAQNVLLPLNQLTKENGLYYFGVLTIGNQTQGKIIFDHQSGSNLEFNPNIQNTLLFQSVEFYSSAPFNGQFRGVMIHVDGVKTIPEPKAVATVFVDGSYAGFMKSIGVRKQGQSEYEYFNTDFSSKITFPAMPGETFELITENCNDVVITIPDNLQVNVYFNSIPQTENYNWTVYHSNFGPQTLLANRKIEILRQSNGSNEFVYTDNNGQFEHVHEAGEMYIFYLYTSDGESRQTTGGGNYLATSKDYSQIYDDAGDLVFNEID